MMPYAPSGVEWLADQRGMSTGAEGVNDLSNGLNGQGSQRRRDPGLSTRLRLAFPGAGPGPLLPASGLEHVGFV